MTGDEQPYYERMDYRDLDDLIETTLYIVEMSFEVTAVVGLSPELESLLRQVERLKRLTRPAIAERERRHSAAAALVQDIEI